MIFITDAVLVFSLSAMKRNKKLLIKHERNCKTNITPTLDDDDENNRSYDNELGNVNYDNQFASEIAA